MNGKEQDIAARKYYAEHYDIVADYEFVAQRITPLNDHDPKDQAARCCRFCNRVGPTVTFRKKAHAVPELLGNKAIRSMNECDACNEFFAEEYESHLGNWSLFARSVSQVKGKDGAPNYTSPDDSMRLENAQGKLAIQLNDKSVFERAAAAAAAGSPFSLTLPSDALSPRFVPLRAAKALVKAACSVCPLSNLDKCQKSIDWLMNRASLPFKRFPVFCGFTPGPADAFKSKVTVLRRREVGREPYLWCIVQYLNHRLQCLVPSLGDDDGLLFGDEPVPTSSLHYRPPEIPFDWTFGESDYRVEDWSSEDERQWSATVSFNVLRYQILPKNTEA